MYKLLIVDDDVKNLRATQSFLSAHNYLVKTTSSPNEAIDLVKNEEFALTLLDFQMPEMMGDVLATLVKKTNPNQQVAMYSCDLSRDALKSSMRAGAADFIDKSMEPGDLLKTISLYCKRYDEAYRTIRLVPSKSENRKIIEAADMIGESQVLADSVRQLIRIASVPDTSVLVHGESGTGKELAAKAIHRLSSRAKGNFVAINCAAIPKELLESELFGHKKGSFTGAISDKMGKFEFANNGTLFLDEIGDMPIDLQAKLLRVLQEREVVPVGSKLSHKINVRLICATHRDLKSLVAEGLFREDLFYRINVVQVDLPPLRARVDDIEPLVGFFTERYNKKHNTTKYFQRRTVEILKKYSWPGNVRELESMVEKHLVITDSSIIGPSDLDPKFYENQSAGAAGLTFEQFRKLKHDEEIKFLNATLKETGGNKAQAARRLGISDNHLRHLLKA